MCRTQSNIFWFSLIKTNTPRKISEDKINRAIKTKSNKDIRKFLKSEEDYFKPVRVDGFVKDNHIEYQSRGGKDKNQGIL